MKVVAKFPAGTVRNADFVTRSSKLKPGERIVHLQVDAEDLPPVGWLCVKESTVLMMAKKLGFELATDLDAETIEHIESLNRKIAELEHQLLTVKKAVA